MCNINFSLLYFLDVRQLYQTRHLFHAMRNRTNNTHSGSVSVRRGRKTVATTSQQLRSIGESHSCMSIFSLLSGWYSLLTFLLLSHGLQTSQRASTSEKPNFELRLSNSSILPCSCSSGMSSTESLISTESNFVKLVKVLVYFFVDLFVYLFVCLTYYFICIYYITI